MVRTVAIVLCTVALVLLQRISSFPLFPADRHVRRQQRVTPKKISSTNTDVEDAVGLGRAEFEKYFQFPLDDWQLEAGGSIVMGHNVIVCAPTGSGKTVVGEMALRAAFDRDLDGIYTTPLKALSNEKFTDLRQIFGNANVGLSTGDISINRDAARLTVMTTEVYRNIAWRSSGVGLEEDEIVKEQVPNNESSVSNDLRKNSVVVLDEFHYMGQPGRGGKQYIFPIPYLLCVLGFLSVMPSLEILISTFLNPPLDTPAYGISPTLDQQSAAIKFI